MLKVGSELPWLWVTTDQKSKQILSLPISKERKMFVAAERYISNLVRIYGKHSVSTDDGTWYTQTFGFLNLVHHLHSTYEKSLMEIER